jgi:hypothetical protein
MSASTREAMTYVHNHLASTLRGLPQEKFDPAGNIEIADQDGNPVARIYFSEVLY